jgi:predicted GTPase
VDLVLFMADVSPGSLERSASLAPLLLKTKRPVIVALNKIDLELITGVHPQKAVAGGLGLVRGNGQLEPQHLV